MRVKLHRRVLVTMCESRTDKGIEKERGEQGRIVGRRGKGSEGKEQEERGRWRSKSNGSYRNCEGKYCSKKVSRKG